MFLDSGCLDVCGNLSCIHKRQLSTSTAVSTIRPGLQNLEISISGVYLIINPSIVSYIIEEKDQSAEIAKGCGCLKFYWPLKLICRLKFLFLTNYRLKRSLFVKLKDWISNSVDPDEMAHMSRLIWIYAVCKRLLLSSVAVKELRSYFFKSLKFSLVLFIY